MIRLAAQKVWQVGIALVGGALVAVGTVFLVLPGPGLPVIVLGVAVLAYEFETPRRWQRRAIASWRAWCNPPTRRHAEASRAR